MLLRSLKSDWIANFSILANLSTNWDTVEIFLFVCFTFLEETHEVVFFFLRRKQSRIISVSRINLHQCKFFYSVWLSFPSPFSHHFAQRSSWDIEELISDLKRPCAATSAPCSAHMSLCFCALSGCLCLWACCVCDPAVHLLCMT